MILLFECIMIDRISLSECIIECIMIDRISLSECIMIDPNGRKGWTATRRDLREPLARALICDTAWWRSSLRSPQANLRVCHRLAAAARARAPASAGRFGCARA